MCDFWSYSSLRCSAFCVGLQVCVDARSEVTNCPLVVRTLSRYSPYSLGTPGNEQLIRDQPGADACRPSADRSVNWNNSEAETFSCASEVRSRETA